MVNEVIENMRTNLDHGQFRFVVLMDNLESRLKDLIIFLNQNSRFDIYGVELEYYKFKDYEIVIPKLFGAEVKKEVSTSSRSGNTRRKWDEVSFFEEVNSNLGKPQAEAIREFYNFSKQTSDKINWGTGTLNGSFNPIYKSKCPRSIFTVYTNGDLIFNHHWMEDNDEMINLREEIKVEFYNLFSKSERINSDKIEIDDWMKKVDMIKRIFKRLILDHY